MYSKLLHHFDLQEKEGKNINRNGNLIKYMVHINIFET